MDANNDNFYSPDSGDYPQMDGDKMLYWVFNDKGGPHDETGGLPIGLEIHAFAYGFDCPASDPIHNTIFLRYKIINKGSLTLSETYAGIWADFDIGLFSDDYVGIDTLRGTMFAYNGDPMDDGASGYGTNPPAEGVPLLFGPQDDQGVPMNKWTNFMDYENDLSNSGNPTTATHHYNYMKSIWKDSSNVVNNGTNGYPGNGSGPLTTFMYPGDGGWCGGTATGWSEVSAGNQPFDRRGLGTVGPFTLAPGETNEVVVAYTYARGFYNNNLGSVCELQSAIDTLRNFFSLGSVSPCNGSPTGNPNNVWPGDANSDNVANVYDALAIGYAYGDTGLPRPNASLLWTGQPAPNWGDTLPTYGSDFKHIDCDGDSIIDSLDGQAILQNYGYTHPKTHGTASGAPILEIAIMEDSLEAGDTLHIEVSLGDSLNPTDSLLGIAFSIAYDPDLVEPGGISVDYSDCWLGNRGSDLFALNKDLRYRGQLDIGLTRIDHLGVVGQGNLVKINVVTIDNISGKNDLIANTLGFQIIEAQAISRYYEDVQVGYGGDSTIVYQQGTSTGPRPSSDLFRIYPNPAANQVYIQTEGATLRNARLINLMGQTLLETRLSGQKQTLSLQEFPAGSYLLEVRTSSGTHRNRLTISK